jgi:putative FmdB family regulatory protein
MPLYEYRCETCNEVFEAMQKFSDEPLTVHENCGGRVERLLSAPAFHLKGSGWYITDYARGGGKKDGKAEGSKAESGDKGESKSESKSEAKPESKTESKTESKPSTPTPSSNKSA